MRFMRANSTITPPRSATAPPESPVPAPRATMGSPLARAHCTTRLTSAGDSGIEDCVGPAAVEAGVDLEGDQFGRVGDKLVRGKAASGWCEHDQTPNGTRMTRIGRISTDSIRENPYGTRMTRIGRISAD